MQLTCPCCHAHVPLEAALQDEAGRELVAALAAMQPALALPLVHYLGYFRPAKQQLGWGRALRLMREVLALCQAVQSLEAALLEANRALDDKRAAPGWKPLGNHNYLRRCLESTVARTELAAQPAAVAAPGGGTPAPRSRVGAGLVNLEGMKR